MVACRPVPHHYHPYCPFTLLIVRLALLTSANILYFCIHRISVFVYCCVLNASAFFPVFLFHTFDEDILLPLSAANILMIFLNGVTHICVQLRNCLPFTLGKRKNYAWMNDPVGTPVGLRKYKITWNCTLPNE